VILEDVRFKDESEFIQRKGGYIIKVIRPTNEEKTEINNHSSEKEMNSIKPDVVIVNDGTLEELYKKIDDELRVIMLSNGIKVM